MNKKILLFTTRYLEDHSGLFVSDSFVKNAFTENEKYCDFFIKEKDTEKTSPDIIAFLYEKYYEELLTPIFRECKIRNEKFWDALEKTKNNNDKYSDLLQTIEDESEDDDCDPILPKVKILTVEDDVKYEIYKEKIVSTNKLIKHFNGNHEAADERLKTKLDIDCELKGYEIGWRFKLYKLPLSDDGVYAAYAVWSLSGKIDHNEYAWYEALCNEILYQEKIDGPEKIDEINLFLHDKDITDSSIFKVLYYNKSKEEAEFSFLPENVKLNVAVFQHNDRIGKILSTKTSDDEEKKNLLKSACDEMEKGGKLSFLYELSDYVALWHDGGKENYQKTIHEASTTYDINNLITKIDGNIMIEDVLSKIKEEIDIILKPHDEEYSK